MYTLTYKSHAHKQSRFSLIRPQTACQTGYPNNPAEKSSIAGQPHKVWFQHGILLVFWFAGVLVGYYLLGTGMIPAIPQQNVLHIPFLSVSVVRT